MIVKMNSQKAEEALRKKARNEIQAKIQGK